MASVHDAVALDKTCIESNFVAQAPSATSASTIEEGVGMGNRTLSPRLEALPAGAASSQAPWAVLPMDAFRNWSVSPAIWLASGLLPKSTLNTLSSPLL